MAKCQETKRPLHRAKGAECVGYLLSFSNCLVFFPWPLTPGSRHLVFPPGTYPSPMELDHVFINQEVIAVDHLPLEFAVAPDARKLQLGEEIVVDMRRQINQAGTAL